MRVCRLLLVAVAGLGLTLLGGCGGRDGARSAGPAAAVASASLETATPRPTRTPRPVALLPLATPTPDQRFVVARSLMLGPGELPPGFAQTGEFSDVAGEPGQISSSGVLYAQNAGPGASQALVLDLDVFADQSAVAAAFKAVVNEPSQGTGFELYRRELDNQPHVGDETVAFRLAGKQNDALLNGYFLVFRRGRFAVTLIQLARPDPESMQGLLAIARQQDAKLQAAIAAEGGR